MTKLEMHEFLRNNPSEIYVIKYNNKEELIHFMRYKDSFFESDVCITRHEMKSEKELIEYVRSVYKAKFFEQMLEEEKKYWKDEFLYDIDYPQCLPFLPDKIESIRKVRIEDVLEYIHKNWVE